MDLRDDITDRLAEMVTRIPKSIEHPRNPEKITLVQAYKEILRLRETVKALTDDYSARIEPPTDPRYYGRATRAFTPEEAADFLEEAMADDLRHTANHREALETLFAIARKDVPDA